MKFFNEDSQIADADRATTSVGPGSRENPFYNNEITTNSNVANYPTGPKNLPFEIRMSVEEIGEIYIKMLAIRKQYLRANNNPSVKRSQKLTITKIQKRINRINRLLLSIPNLLDELVENT